MRMTDQDIGRLKASRKEGFKGRNFGDQSEPTSRAASQSSGGGLCGKKGKRGMGA